MPSSKLSPRTGTAKKPSICITRALPLPLLPWTTSTRILYSYLLYPYPPTLLVKDITFKQVAGEKHAWYWYNPATALPKLEDCLIIIPKGAPDAYARLRARDQLDVLRTAETSFGNPGPPPNAFTIYYWDYQSHPDDTVSIENPV